MAALRADGISPGARRWAANFLADLADSRLLQPLKPHLQPVLGLLQDYPELAWQVVLTPGVLLVMLLVMRVRNRRKVGLCRTECSSCCDEPRVLLRIIDGMHVQTVMVLSHTNLLHQYVGAAALYTDGSMTAGGTVELQYCAKAQPSMQSASISHLRDAAVLLALQTAEGAKWHSCC